MTNTDHLPEEKMAYLNQTPAWCKEQARRIGGFCAEFIDELLGDKVLDRLRAAQGLLRLARKYGAKRLDKACRRALAYDNIRYHTVKRILEHGLDQLTRNPQANLSQQFTNCSIVASPKKTVKARNLAQQNYVNALKHHEMVFATGPAGTGKTYLAVAFALFMLHERRVRRIILTRPAVEAGEKLGFLPGDLAEKVNPYLRPLYDALHDMLGPQKMQSMQETGVIEVAPLAFMRGRTLNDAFIILDEAQNTTREQMKMFLTRLGFGSRAVITGDITQIDLPEREEKGPGRSGLVHALSVLHGIQGIHSCHFQAADVVRHPLVGRIVHAYDIFEQKLRPAQQA